MVPLVTLATLWVEQKTLTLTEEQILLKEGTWESISPAGNGNNIFQEDSTSDKLCLEFNKLSGANITVSLASNHSAN